MPKKISLEPRKKPRQRRSTDTVEVILEAAARILEAGGLDGFNTNAVAIRAGVSIGSLYQYFPSKDALMAALIEADTQAFARIVSQAIEDLSDQPFDQGLGQLIRLALDHQTTRPQLARLIDLEEARLGMVDHVKKSAELFQQLIAAFLALHFAHLPTEIRDQLSRDIIGITRGMIDAEVLAGTINPPQLQHRISLAVQAYLSTQVPRAIG
jgi:AcrR family transcriptional regulator